MATVQSEDDPLGTLTGGGESGSQTTTGGATPVGTTGTSGSGTTAGTGAPSSASAAAPDVQKSADLNQSFDWSPLMSFVGGQGTQARNAITGATDTFNTALGATPVFGQDQQNTLSGVLQGSQPVSAGQSLLNTQYTGPTGIDRTTYDPLVQNYMTGANETGASAGLSALLGQMDPTISAGDRSYDATLFGANPTFQAQSRNAISDANTVAGMGDTAAANAQTAIGQRKSDIGAFNTAGQGYVTSQRDAINQAINAQMNNVNSRQSVMNDAIAALRGGTKNFADYDPSYFGFDTGQYANPQTVAANQSQYIVPAGTTPAGGMNLAGMLYAAGFPSLPQGLQPTKYAQEAPNTFSQAIDPRQFLQYAAGNPLTRQQAATKDQASQYDIAEQLLNQYDYLDPATAGGAAAGGGNIGFNTSAFQQALAQAQQQAAATDAKNKDWYNQQLDIQNLPLTGGLTGHWQTPTGGGIPVDAKGVPLTAAQLAAANAPQPQSAMSPTDWWNENWRSGAAPPTGYAGGGGAGYAAGGVVRARGQSRSNAGMTNPLAKAGSGAPPTFSGANALHAPGSSPINNSSMLNPLGQMGYRTGGHIPSDAGIPGKTDSVPVMADAGEYVMSKPAVAAIGPQAMDALHQALTRAAVGGRHAPAARR